jgi:hypothetical protein
MSAVASIMLPWMTEMYKNKKELSQLKLSVTKRIFGRNEDATDEIKTLGPSQSNSTGPRLIRKNAAKGGTKRFVLRPTKEKMMFV